MADGSVVLVTGASRGVGAVTVARLLDSGARVIAVSRTLADRRTDQVLELAADLADPASSREVVAAGVEAFGRLDALVNNAALDLAAPLLETSVEDAQRVFAVNALAPLWMIQAAAPALAERGGAIVNVTSRLAHIGVPEMVVYGASKGALRALTHGAAVEFAPMGIRVNAVAPGMTETPLFSRVARGSTGSGRGASRRRGADPTREAGDTRRRGGRDPLPAQRFSSAHHRRHPAGRRRLYGRLNSLLLDN